LQFIIHHCPRIYGNFQPQNFLARDEDALAAFGIRGGVALAGVICTLDLEPKLTDMTATTLLQHSLQQHLDAIKALLDMRIPEIERSGEMICAALARGHKVLLCGNGGSAADAQHIAAELVGRYELQRRAWPSIALTTDTSALTALSNDFGYEEVFARQVEALATEGDVLIALSTSGTSANVIRAAETARNLKCRTIALTGGTGEPLSSLCDVVVNVPSERTSRIQEAHITIGHLWCEMVDALL
jgi:D-sedoheptulose 7-phosphate isomerase